MSGRLILRPPHSLFKFSIGFKFLSSQAKSTLTFSDSSGLLMAGGAGTGAVLFRAMDATDAKESFASRMAIERAPETSSFRHADSIFKYDLVCTRAPGWGDNIAFGVDNL